MTREYETDLTEDARWSDEKRISGLLDRLQMSLRELGTVDVLAPLTGYMLDDIERTIEELEIMDIRLTK